MNITATGITDVGCVRRSNEDSLGLFEDLGLFVVADGMGGHAAGEVASQMAVNQIKGYYSERVQGENITTPQEKELAGAISHANRKIFTASLEDASLNGMGTTVVALLANPKVVVIGFVGDSRVYLYQHNTVQQLTHDHSLVNEYVKRGILAPEAADSHPQKHVLSRALGTGAEVEIETFSRVPLPGDIFLLCSDGLSNKLSSDEIHAILIDSKEDIEGAARKMVDRAKEKGGEDNISIVIVAY